MKTVSKISALRKILDPIQKKKTIGLVPTMGAFHEGHLALMRAAKRECDTVVVSLFVNPIQFGPKEDFERYPRDLRRDQTMAARAGVDLLWTPAAEELYPGGYATFVEVEGLTRRWEGAARPGHFRGVTTVVSLLFQTVRPHRAYFGWKDYQQARTIEKMIRDLRFDIRFRALPTVREKDGLAMSSRNRRLSLEDRKIAPILYRALQEAKRAAAEGEREGRALAAQAESLLRSEPRIEIDYLALCDSETLEPIDRLREKGVLLVAARIGSVRLIDNMILEVNAAPEEEAF